MRLPSIWRVHAPIRKRVLIDGWGLLLVFLSQFVSNRLVLLYLVCNVELTCKLIANTLYSFIS